MMRRRVLFGLLLSLLASGCSFAYYNTFFNAKRYYKEAEALPMRDDGRPAASAVQSYNKAIQKCGIIITEYKETKWVDDALFLLAKSMYHKGNAYVQAGEKFEDLIEYYPDSPFIPEAHVYLARCRRKLNQKEDAYRMGQELLVGSENRDLQPEVLLMLAEWRIEDEDYIRAENLLHQLLDEHPDSDEFADAYFLLGLTYQSLKQYEKSNEVFQRLLETKVPRRTKMDARFNIATNLLEAGQYEQSLADAKELKEEEYNEDALPRIDVLLARNYAALGRNEEAIELLDNVLTVAPRTYVAAEAAYRLAEVYFLQVLDYEKAIEFYNRVKREKGDSPFVENAVSRSAVASQIVQFQDTDRDIPVQSLIDEQFKLAEYYLDVLSMPDSTLAVYHRIHKQQLRMEFEVTRLDSLLQVQLAVADTTDSLGIARADSLQLSLQQTRDIARQYEEQFSPFSYFCEIWLYASVKQDTATAHSKLAAMQETFPGNRYTVGAEDYLAGRDVQFVTPHEWQARQAYSGAISTLESDPWHTVQQLQVVLQDYGDVIGPQTLYSLGWVSLFTMQDTLAAAAWFDSLYAIAPESEYTASVQNYYVQGSFERLDELPALVTLREAEATAAEEAAALEQEQAIPTTGPAPTTPRDAIYDVPPYMLVEYYPPNNTGKPIFGETYLNVEVLVDGTIGAVELVQSYDDSPGGLDELAFDAIRRWEFEPARLNDEPVACWIVVPIRFAPLNLEQ